MFLVQVAGDTGGSGAGYAGGYGNGSRVGMGARGGPRPGAMSGYPGSSSYYRQANTYSEL